MIEQRKNKRFEIKLPLRLLRNGGGTLPGAGETRNISSRGVLFETETELPVDERIEYVITFPASETASLPVDLHCLGKVVRLQRSDSGSGFEVAATLERYEFNRIR